MDDTHEEAQSLIPKQAQGLEGAEGLAEEEDPDSRRALWFSLFSLAISIPALVGAWCWPALVFPLLGMGVTAASRTASHYISFFTNLAITVGICSFLAFESGKRWGSWGHRYGPLLFCLAASIFIMADPSRHLLADLDLWPTSDGSLYYYWTNEIGWYQEGCGFHFTCLTALGLLLSFGVTYTGFGLLVVGSMWNADIIEKTQKLVQTWKELRSGAPIKSAKGKSLL